MGNGDDGAKGMRDSQHRRNIVGRAEGCDDLPEHVSLVVDSEQKTGRMITLAEPQAVEIKRRVAGP